MLKQDLTITMEPTFPDINIDDYTVKIYGPESYERQLNIVSWDNTNKEMKVKFNGAPSNMYIV